MIPTRDDLDRLKTELEQAGFDFRSLQVEHRSIRRDLFGPYREVTVRFPCPRFPTSGQSEF